MKNRFTILGCIMLLAFAACDYRHEQHFYIHNDLDTAILVHFDYYTITDSTVSVAAKNVKEVIEYDGLFGAGTVTDERYNDEFKNIRVETNDTIILLDEALWVFEKETKYVAKSVMKIDTALVH